MLMKTRPDIFYIDPKHDAVDQRLLNWADWVRVKTPHWVSPMFRMAKSNSRQWHTPEFRPTCDILDAAAMEKAVYALPRLHRDVIRWAYVYKYGEQKFRREQGLTLDRLMEVLQQARDMLARQTLG